MANTKVSSIESLLASLLPYARDGSNYIWAITIMITITAIMKELITITVPL